MCTGVKSLIMPFKNQSYTFSHAQPPYLEGTTGDQFYLVREKTPWYLFDNSLDGLQSVSLDVVKRSLAEIKPHHPPHSHLTESYTKNEMYLLLVIFIYCLQYI
jgi:hypothetical protein